MVVMAILSEPVLVVVLVIFMTLSGKVNDVLNNIIVVIVTALLVKEF
ncbi:hypothetical protein BTHERMOSOX_304 [Bathymodiolus thermophilus thioautotrophic gill symbiont]|nr:hypothetical protein BTHERMOSOX_304 [Bathymodiolus thermophilus thioautotrophic gill symbiont]